tara:strand:- start:27 stop:248 length:222 start_codon:yes stop_codon:yes gene_type:complete
MYNTIFKAVLIFFFYAPAAYAYLGPGVGGGVVAATIGIVVAIFAGLFGLIWFPIKKLLNKRKEKKENQLNKVD